MPIQSIQPIALHKDKVDGSGAYCTIIQFIGITQSLKVLSNEVIMKSNPLSSTNTYLVLLTIPKERVDTIPRAGSEDRRLRGPLQRLVQLILRFDDIVFEFRDVVSQFCDLVSKAGHGVFGAAVVDGFVEVWRVVDGHTSDGEGVVVR